MTERENILALLNGEPYERVPVWIMGFENEYTARRLNPTYEFPENFFHNPEKNNYPWDRISDEERQRTIAFNKACMKPVTACGWGANGALGHGGPGEFHFDLIEVNVNERILQCETGCKRLVRKNPHFYKDFDYPMKTVRDFDKLQLPNPHDPKRYKGFDEDVSFFKGTGYLTGANLNGFYSAAHYFCIDYQEFLMSMLLDGENTKKLIDMIGMWNIVAAEKVLKSGAECIILCDDLGSADNLLISPELYEKWILPWHTKLCSMAHEYKAWVHLHSHGNINKILPLVLKAGFDMIDPFDTYESMDLVRFLETHKDTKTVPVGGLHKFFYEWENGKQNEYLTSLFKRANNAGRWIFMDTGGVPETCTKETYDFLMERLGELAVLK